MRNERLKNYVLPRISDKKRYWKDNNIKKIIMNMTIDILRATKLKYGPIHSADPKQTDVIREDN